MYMITKIFQNFPLFLQIFLVKGTLTIHLTILVCQSQLDLSADRYSHSFSSHCRATSTNAELNSSLFHSYCIEYSFYFIINVLSYSNITVLIHPAPLVLNFIISTKAAALDAFGHVTPLPPLFACPQ
jgi:hypothetical protein